MAQYFDKDLLDIIPTQAPGEEQDLMFSKLRNLSLIMIPNFITKYIHSMSLYKYCLENINNITIKAYFDPEIIDLSVLKPFPEGKDEPRFFLINRCLHLELEKYHWILQHCSCRCYVQIYHKNHRKINEGNETKVIGNKIYKTFSHYSICWFFKIIWFRIPISMCLPVCW